MTTPLRLCPVQPAALGTQHLDVGVGPYEAFHLVEHLVHVPDARCHGGEPQAGPLPQVLVGNLGRRHRVALAGAFEDGLDDGPLGLERAAVGQVEVDLQDAYVRGISRSSNVSMMSPSLRRYDPGMPCTIMSLGDVQITAGNPW